MFTIENIWRLKQQCRKTRDFIQGHAFSCVFVCYVIRPMQLYCGSTYAICNKLLQTDFKLEMNKFTKFKITTAFCIQIKRGKNTNSADKINVIYVFVMAHSCAHVQYTQLIWWKSGLYHFMRLHCSRIFKKGWLRDKP